MKKFERQEIDLLDQGSFPFWIPFISHIPLCREKFIFQELLSHSSCISRTSFHSYVVVKRSIASL